MSLVGPEDGLDLRRLRDIGSRFHGLSTFTELTIAFLCFLSIAVMLQLLSGAFESAFAAYPDEPSHYVTGLMVRDYIAGGFPAPPFQYATDYYSHYPKIGIGHWPPVFYLSKPGGCSCLLRPEFRFLC